MNERVGKGMRQSRASEGWVLGWGRDGKTEGPRDEKAEERRERWTDGRTDGYMGKWTER